MDKPNLSSWVASIQAGSPIGTLVSRSYNRGGPAATLTVSAKGGRTFTAREVDGQIELLTGGPLVEGGASPVVVTAKNAAGTSQITCTVTVSPRVVVPAPEPPPVVEPPPPPPPTTTSDIVRPSYPHRAARLRLLGRGGTRIATAAQGFPMGFWPASQTGCLRTLSATRAGLAPGSLLQTQLDCHHRYPDGSARILLLAAEATLEPGEALDVVLEPGAAHNAPGEPLAWSAAASGHTVRAEIPNAPPLDALGAEAGSWRAGPLVIERRAQNKSAGGSRRMALDTSYRADGTVTADAVFAADVAFDGGGGWDGECRLTVDGATRSSGQQHHPAFSRFRLRLSNKPPPHVLFPDVSLLADAGLIPPLYLKLGVPATILVEQAKAMSDPAWGQPYNALGFVQYQPASGARGDIGPVTFQQAVWLLSGGSVEMHDLCAGLLDTAHTIPLHTWDRSTGTPVMCAGQREMAWMDGRGDWSPPQEGPDTNHGWELNLSHAPSLGWAPFLLTGDRAALDVVQSEAAWAIAAAWPYYRNAADGYGRGGLKFIFGADARGMAWALRNVRRAWLATPDTGPAALPAFRAYIGKALHETFAWLQTQIPIWAAKYGEYGGWVEASYGNPGAMAPFQQDYLLGELVGSYLDGWDEVAPVLDFLAGGWLGKRCLAIDGWNPHDGAVYNVPWQDLATGQPITTWAAAAADIVRRGWSSGTEWPGGNFSLLAAYGLTHLATVYPGRPELAQQLRALAAAPGVDAGMPCHDPQFSVMPRGLTRGS